MDKTIGSTWIEINLENIKDNLKNIRKIITPGVKICGVVKADAYGHGSKIVSKYLEEESLVDYIAVSRLEEGIELRQSGLKLPILCLGYIKNDDLEYAVNNDIAVTIYSLDAAKELNKVSSLCNKKSKIHIKIDTGMSRIGFKSNEESVNSIIEISKMDNLYIEGIYTHFATADEEDKTNTRLQVSAYNYIIEKLMNKGIDIPIKHISNSAATMDLEDLNLDMVRCGIIMYGHYPSNEINKHKLKLKNAMTFKTRISHIKEIETGVGVSYGYTYKASKTEKIVTLPVGYADGFTRMQKNPKVSIKGELFEVVGRICMDQCMVRIDKDIDIKVGDEVVMFGNDVRSVEDVAEALGTINYEVLCMISRRVSRVYINDKGVVISKNYLIEG